MNQSLIGKWISNWLSGIWFGIQISDQINSFIIKSIISYLIFNWDFSVVELLGEDLHSHCWNLPGSRALQAGWVILMRHPWNGRLHGGDTKGWNCSPWSVMWSPRMQSYSCWLHFSQETAWNGRLPSGDMRGESALSRSLLRYQTTHNSLSW